MCTHIDSKHTLDHTGKGENRIRAPTMDRRTDGAINTLYMRAVVVMRKRSRDSRTIADKIQSSLLIRNAI